MSGQGQEQKSSEAASEEISTRPAVVVTRGPRSSRLPLRTYQPSPLTTIVKKNPRFQATPQRVRERDFSASLTAMQETQIIKESRKDPNKNFFIRFVDYHQPEKYVKDWATHYTDAYHADPFLRAPDAYLFLIEGEWEGSGENQPKIERHPYHSVHTPIIRINRSRSSRSIGSNLALGEDKVEEHVIDNPAHSRIIDDVNITLAVVTNPTESAQEAVNRLGACGLFQKAICGTPQRKVGCASLIFLFLAGIAVMGYFVNRVLHPDCQEDLSLTPHGSNEIFGLIPLLFGILKANTNRSEVQVEMACSSLNAKDFHNRGQASLILPKTGELEAYVATLEIDTLSDTEASLNVSHVAHNISCGVTRNAQLSLQISDKRDNIHRASLPFSLLGQASAYEMSLSSNFSLEANHNGTPFETLSLNAFHPEYSNRPSLVLPLYQTNIQFSNLDEMKHNLETLAANPNPEQNVDFSPRSDQWWMTGRPNTLKDILSKFIVSVEGDTATPGSNASTLLKLGLLDPCATTANTIDWNHTQLDYVAYEIPLRLSDQACSTQISVSAGSSAAYTPFACLNLQNGSRYGNYSVLTTGTLTAGQAYPNAMISRGLAIYSGNFSDISIVKTYQEFIDGNQIPSGSGVYYRSGVTVIDHHSNQSFNTSTIPLFVNNPAETFTFSGPTHLTCPPGQVCNVFSAQSNQGNYWDLMRLQVTSNVLGLQFNNDLNVIPVGSSGFICIQTMPYCSNYLSQAQLYLPIGLSGTWSYAHFTLTQTGLVSGLSTQRILDISGCNLVVLPGLLFSNTPGIVNDYQFYPARVWGLSTTLDAKDALRSDISAYARIFDLTQQQVWSTQNFVGSFSGVQTFLNGQVVNIPYDWLPGTQTTFNFTMCAGFNASDCDGSPIISQCQSRVLVQEVVNFPELIETPEGNLIPLTPGQAASLGDAFIPLDQNLAQTHNVTLNCSEVSSTVPIGWEGLCFSGLPFFNSALNANQTTAQQFLRPISLLAPDYSAIDPSANSILAGCQAACDVKYGQAMASTDFQR